MAASGFGNGDTDFSNFLNKDYRWVLISTSVGYTLILCIMIVTYITGEPIPVIMVSRKDFVYSCGWLYCVKADFNTNARCITCEVK